VSTRYRAMQVLRFPTIVDRLLSKCVHSIQLEATMRSGIGELHGSTSTKEVLVL
jgi:hypothetical protein